MEIYDIVQRLIGPIHSTGCHSTDTKNKENLKKMTELFLQIGLDLTEISEDSFSYEDSVRRIGKDAWYCLEEMGRYIDREKDRRKE